MDVGPESGKAPQRPTREIPVLKAQPDKQSRTDLYKSKQNQADAGDSKVEETERAEMRVGVDDTHVFHRTECLVLKDVPVAHQVRFTSRWDALDGGYRPCEECKAAQ